mmetsp:Transcript_19693/g.17875  ORF Transcript_19693/g.17875 Transcript_19693/m.17875 type:complete len:530 (+) Transcript_19693:381-1970(+)
MLFNDEALNVNDYSFVWTIDDVNYEGSSIYFQINKVDVQTASITATKDDYSFTTYFKLAIKYVRREIRSLTDEDRENFLNSLNILYTTSKSDGVAKYGLKFISAEDFSYKHLNGAARVDCDHWHDGAGILNHHVAYTLEVEQALQSIDPSISMPYWEYAMDSTLYDDWQDSVIFNDDWFGDNSPGNDLHELNTGRWGDVLVPLGDSYKEWSIAETSSLNPFVNGRGHLRSPWNNNPSRYIGRYNSTYGAAEIDMPTCDIVYECYRSTVLGYMLNCLNGVTHGPVHVKIGGAWEDTDLYTDDDIHFLKSIDRVLVFELLWRTGYTRCPTACDDVDECTCSIPQQYLDSYGAKEILVNSGVWDVYSGSKTLSKLTDSQLLTVLKIIQDPGVVGDMFTSAASFDPIFWPLHGQIERIIGLKRIKLMTDNDILFEEGWSFYNDDNRVLNGVCDWSGISSVDDLTLPNCDFSGAQSCWGHNADDVLEWSNFINNNEIYSNKDFYDFIHPWNEKLPYVYDTYSFSYCDSSTYPFE